MNKPWCRNYDLVVIGGGNAGLCAAITAAESGVSVLILEAAPEPYRGGNSRHTRNFRCMHQGPLGPLAGEYLEPEYFADLLEVTEGETDDRLARLAIQSSEACLPWMEAHGVRFQSALSGTLSLSRTNAFFMGGGKALVNAYYRTAKALGIDVLYNAKATHLELSEARISRIDFRYKEEQFSLSTRSVVVASGGFQANLEWLSRAWGAAAGNFLVRGSPYNRGEVLSDLISQGVETIGDPTQCHAVAIDGRAPRYDGGIVTRLDCIPFSIVVNGHGKRFYDEGEDVWPKRYAIWGRLVAEQPDQISYAIFDSKSIDLYIPSAFPPLESASLESLAEKMALPADALVDTVNDFNAACDDGRNFDPATLDGVSTRGIDPPKSNWARPVSTPPFYGYTLRTGVTFTYLGLKIDEHARCSSSNGKIENLWAAGETMAGSILGKGYLAGFGMTVGTVFGRIAGREAAAYAR